MNAKDAECDEPRFSEYEISLWALTADELSFEDRSDYCNCRIIEALAKTLGQTRPERAYDEKLLILHTDGGACVLQIDVAIAIDKLLSTADICRHDWNITSAKHDMSFLLRFKGSHIVASRRAQIALGLFHNPELERCIFVKSPRGGEGPVKVDAKEDQSCDDNAGSFRWRCLRRTCGPLGRVDSVLDACARKDELRLQGSTHRAYRWL